MNIFKIEGLNLEVEKRAMGRKEIKMVIVWEGVQSRLIVKTPFYFGLSF